MAHLLIGAIIVYAIKTREGQRNRNVETSAVDAARSEVTSNNQISFELSSEREAQEVLNERRDRAELSHFWKKPPVELSAR